MSATILWPLLIGIAGALIGSFVAALAIRWPQGQSVMTGRSRCDGCGRTLSAAELVPLASALVLRDRCRSCGATIDPLHRRVELAGLAIGVIAGWAVPGPAALAGAVFGWLLLALATLDLVAWWLPDRLTATLALAGIGGAAAGVAPDLGDRLIGGVCGYLGLWLVAEGYKRVRGRVGMGGGDPKLLGAIGLWVGWRMLPAVLLIACLIGLAAVLVQHLRGRAVARDTALPFGALLAIAAYPAWIAMVGSLL